VKFFRAKTGPENAVGMLGTEVGALFQITGNGLFIQVINGSGR